MTSGANVLYIGGMGRSGSTLLQAMLGQLPGFVAAGEVRYLWQRGPVDDVTCSCGQPFSACPFWTAVGESAFGHWGAIDARGVLELQRSVDRHRYLPEVVVPLRRDAFEARLDRYLDILRRLYAAIAEVAGAAVVVDSTKDPPHAFLLRRALGDRLRVAHLVRDSRGVAYSWTRKVRRPEVADGEAFMEQVAPATMAVKWTDYNLLFHLLARLGTASVLLRYEDVVADPGAALRRLAVLAGQPVPPGPLPGESGAVEIAPEHTLSGNPMRFSPGPVALEADERWRDAMPAGQRRTVSLLTAPLLAAYGYAPSAIRRPAGARR